MPRYTVWWEGLPRLRETVEAEDARSARRILQWALAAHGHKAGYCETHAKPVELERLTPEQEASAAKNGGE